MPVRFFKAIFCDSMTLRGPTGEHQHKKPGASAALLDSTKNNKISVADTLLEGGVAAYKVNRVPVDNSTVSAELLGPAAAAATATATAAAVAAAEGPVGAAATPVVEVEGEVEAEAELGVEVGGANIAGLTS